VRQIACVWFGEASGANPTSFDLFFINFSRKGTLASLLPRGTPFLRLFEAQKTSIQNAETLEQGARGHWAAPPPPRSRRPAKKKSCPRSRPSWIKGCPKLRVDPLQTSPPLSRRQANPFGSSPSLFWQRGGLVACVAKLQNPHPRNRSPCAPCSSLGARRALNTRETARTARNAPSPGVAVSNILTYTHRLAPLLGSKTFFCPRRNKWRKTDFPVVFLFAGSTPRRPIRGSIVPPWSMEA